MSTFPDTQFQTLAQYSPDMICSVDGGNIMRYASPSCERILGWKPEELVGKGPEHFIHPEDLPAVDAAAARTFQMDQQGAPVRARMRRQDGSYAWMDITASVVRDAETGAVSEAVIVMRDVSERQALEERLAKLALKDGLTGLANRRAFDEALDREWKRTAREGSQISLLMLDVDHFKTFNDRYGHQAGDDCLRAVALAVAGCLCRPEDLAARYGGEELAVILPGMDMAGAASMADQVRSAIEALCIPHLDNHEGASRLTASIGAATALARPGGTMRMPESLLLAADNALYTAKREGRNRIATQLLIAPKQDR